MIISLIILRMKGKLFLLFMFALFGTLLGGFVLLIREVPRYTVSRHAFEPSPLALVLTSALSFTVLLALWRLTGRVVSRVSGQSEAEVLDQDFLTYLPLVFLSLAPLTLRHFISSADLAARLKLFALALATAIVYLKAVQTGRWSKTRVWIFESWRRKFDSLSIRRRIVILFLVSLLAFNVGTLLLVSKGATFSGDEPHYLMICHSLLKDGDFDLANNYDKRDYAGFMRFEGKIAAHVVPGAEPGRRYSFHSPGVAFLVFPFYALSTLFKGPALVFFIRLGMSIWGAFFAVQIYLYARKEWDNEGLALKLCFLTSLTTPVFFYSIHIYPEIIVAGFALAVFRILRFSPVLSAKKAAVCGLLLGSFFWFHALKYIALFMPFLLYGVWRLVRRPQKRRSLALFVLITAAVILTYLQFQHALYGTYSLSTVSWAAEMTDTGEKFVRFAKTLLFEISPRDRWGTLAGYFFDQRDGLLFYTPIFFFSLFGAIEMLRRKRKEFWLLLALAAPYVLVSAFLTQRTGYAPQARPLVAVIWWLSIWLGYFLFHNRKAVFCHIFDLAAGLSFFFVFLLLKTPLFLYQETTRGTLERGGGLFFSLSNLHFHLTNFLPSYIKSGEGAWLPNPIWLVLIAFFIGWYLISKKRPVSLKPFAHILLACTGVVIFFISIVLYPRLVLRQPTQTALGAGRLVTFYSLSRAARMIEPGRFRLHQDGRSYRFYMTTERPLDELRVTLGSIQGTYDFSVSLFDEVLVRGKTIDEIKEIRIPRPPRYSLREKVFYTIVLELGKGENSQIGLTPYVFELSSQKSD